MLHEELVLDVGTGLGGEYLNHENPSRLLSDKGICLLQEAQKSFALPAIIMDATCQQGGGLPFMSESFHKVEMYFPFETLLESLVNPNQIIWSEIFRILKPGGEVSIYVHLYVNSALCINAIEEQPHFIFRPVKKIEEAMQSNGFQVGDRRLVAEEELLQMKTFSSEGIIMRNQEAGWLRYEGAYQIKGIKSSNIPSNTYPPTSILGDKS